MSLRKSTEQTESHSEEAEEIFGKIPNFLIRWGITIIFVSILVFFATSWFIKYPDTISGSIIITTQNPPTIITAKTNGKIEEFFVKDNESVKEDAILGVLQSGASYNDVMILKKKLADKSLIYKNFQGMGELHLGPVQSSYLSYIKCQQDYTNFLQLNYYNKKISVVTRQIEKLKLYSNQLENAESKLLTEIQLSQLEQNLLDLQLQFTEEKNKLDLHRKETLDNLNESIASWELNYLFKTPTAGKVALTSYAGSNREVKPNDIILTIVPDSISPILGKINLPIQNSGKVDLGQKVNIKLDNYPYMEYGTVQGIITYIAPFPSDNNYPLEVSFPHGLKSTYGENLKFTQKMLGTAEIITNDVRLFNRLVKPLKSTLKTGLN